MVSNIALTGGFWKIRAYKSGIYEFGILFILGGGFKDFLCSLLLAEIIQLTPLTDIFQRG